MTNTLPPLADERFAETVWAWGREWIARLAAGDLNAAGVVVGYADAGGDDGSVFLHLAFPPRIGTLGWLTLRVTQQFFFTHYLPLLTSAPPAMTRDEEAQFFQYFATLVQTFYPGMMMDAAMQKGIASVLGIPDAPAHAPA